MWTEVRTRANGEPVTANNTAEDRIRSLGIEVPDVPKPPGGHVDAVKSGNLLFLVRAMHCMSGQPKFVRKLSGESQMRA